MVQETEVKSSWADQVEEGETNELPPPHEEFDEKNGLKIITEYKLSDEGKKIKVVKTFKLETKKLSKSIARRKAWPKFGAASRDPPGPNPSNTIISEDIFMQFVHSKTESQRDQDDEEDPLAKLKGAAKMVSCRLCKGDHWTTRCPYKDTLEPLKEGGDTTDGAKDAAAAAPAPNTTTTAKIGGTGKYVPPNLRGDGANRRGETMMSKNTRDDAATIRVTNLSEDTRENDLQELFRPFGSIQRIYLAKDKNTGHSKGFAFINFHRKEDAARAISGVCGYGYDHLILNVEWAKPSAT